tara:strand:+ start:25 stop:1059 length:1035 start_codon:yes stop_codon:yes gene_type:complete
MFKLTSLITFVIIFSSEVFASTDVVNKVFPATVLITAEDKNGQPQSLGSGFLISPNIIATNFHVIENSYSGYVKFVNKDEIYEIEGVVGYDISYDLALIKIGNNDGTPLLLKSPSVDIGQKVFAIGNPLGLEGTISDGIVSGLREIGDFSVLQISAPISPGNSGGPVVNEKGEVIGVATFTFSEGQNINFAVPIKYLKELLDNKIELVELASLVKKQENNSENTSKDFGGISFTKFNLTGSDILSFSIKNNLRKKVHSIHAIWIIYDDDGEPIDYEESYDKWCSKKDKSQCKNGIKPKLAYRTSIRLPRSALSYLYDKDLLDRYNLESYFKLIEYRILDFKIVE